MLRHESTKPAPGTVRGDTRGTGSPSQVGHGATPGGGTSQSFVAGGRRRGEYRYRARLGVSPTSVVSWRERFAAEGLAKFAQVRKGRGRKPSIPNEKVEAIVAATTGSKPAGETHWSCRSMGKAQGVSATTVQRIRSGRGLQPHRVETFKLSNDRRFEQKLVDVVGLYMNPPDKAVVLCLDEKSQIQALDRTQPSLPMKKGRAGTMTHDYKRNGTTTLFAALDVLSGQVFGQCLPQHTNHELLHFLKKLDREVPKGLAVHVITDNYGTRGHDNVQAWLAKHPRFQFHFTPTSSSWLNLVERWFRELTHKAIRRGVFRSVPEFVAAIQAYLERAIRSSEVRSSSDSVSGEAGAIGIFPL